MILTAKPVVRVVQAEPKFVVVVLATDRFHTERWRTHLSAMNCALAIARTSRCATEEERCKP